MLDGGRGIPPGLSSFLRVADPRDGGEGRVTVELPEPAVERLTDSPGARRGLEEALETAWGRPVTLVLEAVGTPGSAEGSGGRRITQDTVREGRLQELVEKEPRLREAVQELDLELLE